MSGKRNFSPDLAKKGLSRRQVAARQPFVLYRKIEIEWEGRPFIHLPASHAPYV